MRKVMLLLREKLLEGFSFLSREKAPAEAGVKPPRDIFGMLHIRLKS